MNQNILIVEDDIHINNMIRDALTKSGYSCIQAFSGTEAAMVTERQELSLILLDLMLPGMNGEAFLTELKQKKDIPVIVVSAKDELDSKVELLTSGAEDYITKPFEIRELLARIAVQLRKRNKVSEEIWKTHRGLQINKKNYQVSIEDTVIPFTKQEFKIMELLTDNPGRIFSKQDIYEYAWDEYFIGEDKTINVHISNIRQKLRAVTEDEYIETVWGIGFKLKD